MIKNLVCTIVVGRAIPEISILLILNHVAKVIHINNNNNNKKIYLVFDHILGMGIAASLYFREYGE